MKKIAAVNDISGFGKCSLAVSIPIMASLGVQCCPLVTGVFSNQTGYDSFYCRDCTDDMEPCIEEWKKLSASFDGILTGFIANGKQGKIIHKLIDVLNKLAEGGNTLVIIEHNLDVIKTADYIIDLGPEGGDGGGTVIAEGTPEQVAKVKESHTGIYLKKILSI